MSNVTQHGFVAIMSAIVISILLLAITVGLGFSGFFGRFNILDSENKERSLALAEACADKAILNFVQNQTYNPVNECVEVGDVCPDGTNICTIVSKIFSGSGTTFKTQACINESVTNLEVIIDNNFTVTSWQELPNFSPNNPCP